MNGLNLRHAFEIMLQDLADIVVAIVKHVVHIILWGFVVFNVGRLTLLLFTAGRYPRGRFLQLHRDRISFVGIAALLTIWSSIAIYNHLHPWNGYA